MTHFVQAARRFQRPAYIILMLFGIVLISSTIWVYAAAPPNTISYQGFLTDLSGNPIEGTYDIGVSYQDAASGGSEFYKENHLGVVLDDGQFNLVLGGGTPISGVWGAVDFGQAIWIEITVAGETLSPLVPMSAAPYARYAYVSQQIGTLNSGKWCTSDGSVINCTQAAPVTSELDPQVGVMSNGKWCTSNGSTVNCMENGPSRLSVNVKNYSASSVFTVQVACTSGDIALGGGCYSTNGGAILVSSPTCFGSSCRDGDSDPTGWNCEFESADSVNTATVLCTTP